MLRAHDDFVICNLLAVSAMGDANSKTLEEEQIFVSYARKDSELVLPEIEWLKGLANTVWYDREIAPGTTWPDELAAAIDDSSFVLFFASSNSIVSTHCLNEIAYALDAGKPVLAIYIEPVELHGGLHLSMSRTHSILRWQLKEDEYRAQLRQAVDNLSKTAAANKTNTGVLPLSAGKILKNIWLVPLHRNVYFTGREGYLDEIGSLFESANKPTILTLTGLGGVGKSQLALEYIYRRMKDHYLVAWIRAESPASIEADFVALANALGLAEATEANMQFVFAAVHAWLETNDNWFFILDNVEGPETVRYILPRDLCGHVLITTRYQGWRYQANSIAVSSFGMDEATKFVMDRTAESDTESATNLARLLGGLPLAIEEACAYMEATGRSIAGYLKLFESHHDELLSKSSPQGDYPATLQTTWEVSFLELEKTEPIATQLLNLLAFLGPDDVPESLLLHCDLFRDDDALSQIGLDSCLASLRRYSLIKVDHSAISIHRLVQLVTRDRMSDEQRKSWALQALQLLEREFPISGAVGDSLPDCGRLLTHATAVLAHTEGIVEAEVCAGKLLGRTGTYQSARGLLKEGTAHLEKAFLLFLKHDSHSNDFAHACELYGRVQYQGGNLDEARELVERAVKVLDEIGDPASLIHSHCLAVLAWIHWSSGDAKSAKDAAQRSINMISQQTSMNDPRVLSGRSVLGRVLVDEGDVQEALKIIDDCVTTIATLGGARQPIMCGVFVHMAQVLVYGGLPLRARSWAQESLNLGGPAYGEHHPLVAGSHCVMGQVMMDIGDFEAAIGEFDATINSVRRATAKISQYSAIASSYMILALLEVGREDDAIALLDECQAIASNKIAGEATLATAHAGLAAARLSSLSGDDKKAIEQCEVAGQLIQTRFGERHIYRVPALITTGCVLSSVGQFTEARNDLDRGLELLSQKGLVEHPQAAACLRELARLSEIEGDTDTANALFEEAAKRLRACTGPSSPATMALEKRITK